MIDLALRQRTGGPRVVCALSPTGAACLVFIGCTGFEAAQRSHWVTGWFDWFDILCYAVGVLVCFSLDRWLTPLERQEKRAELRSWREA
jgi:hypothetical protein